MLATKARACSRTEAWVKEKFGCTPVLTWRPKVLKPRGGVLKPLGEAAYSTTVSGVWVDARSGSWRGKAILDNIPAAPISVSGVSLLHLLLREQEVPLL